MVPRSQNPSFDERRRRAERDADPARLAAMDRRVGSRHWGKISLDSGKFVDYDTKGQVFAADGALILHRSLLLDEDGNTLAWNRRVGWTLTHAPSGMALFKRSMLKKNALLALKFVLEHLSTDQIIRLDAIASGPMTDERSYVADVVRGAWGLSRGVKKLRERNWKPPKATNPPASVAANDGDGVDPNSTYYKAAAKAFKKFHGKRHSGHTVIEYDDGKPGVTVKHVAYLGRVPETHYTVPEEEVEGSNKNGPYWVHKHSKNPEHQPIEVLDPTTGLPTKLLLGKARITDWWRD